MSERIYTVEDHGPRIEAFLRKVIDLAGFDLDFDVATGENPHPEIEDPELVVRFSGRDVDLVLGNKGELLLALEYLTMEALGMPSDHHERLCFDANDYRMLRIPDMPQVDVHIVPSAEPPTGMGEPGLPPLAPAFANAIARLTGKPLRQLPFNLA